MSVTDVNPKLRTSLVSEDNANLTAKELPLTDIAVLPPPFEPGHTPLLPSDVLLELLEIAADSEAETDKMDFFANTSTSTEPGRTETDLQVLSKITVLPTMDEHNLDVEEFMAAPGKRRLDTTAANDDDNVSPPPKRPRLPLPQANGRAPTSPPQAKRPATNTTNNVNDDDEEDEGNVADAGDDGDDGDEGDDGDNGAPSPLALASPDVTHQEADDEDNEDGDNEDNDVADDDDEGSVDLNQQRKLAIIDLIAIEEQFAELRDKLYRDKLLLLERELQLCLEGLHPELLKIYFKINQFYQDNVKLANLNLLYRLRCIDRETVATRTLIHQNFLRQVMEAKNTRVTETTLLWYKINKERNLLDQLVENFNYTALPLAIPAGPGTDEVEMPLATKRGLKQAQVARLVHQRNVLNHQLGVLNGLVEFSGFPVAVLDTAGDRVPPELLLRQASPDEINDDLRDMGII